MDKKFTFIKKILFSRFLPVIAFLLGSMMLSGQTLHVIEVRDFEFDPSELTITAGDTVEWVNEQGSHNVNGTQVTFPSNPESFGNEVGTGWTYQHVFTEAGNYDYQCDPHASAGMNGTIEVLGDGEAGEEFLLTVEFSGMTPHIGQNLFLAVREADTGMEIGRTDTVAASEFTVEVQGIEEGMSYHVDFWVDFNENGRYDTPPVDHAWRLELNDVMGDTTLMFAHNTDFTNIMWENMLSVDFSGMNPHVGQNIYLAVVDTATGMEVGRTHAVADTAFTLMVPGIETGNSYHVDFWVDFNENGMYDAPPTDHAWRLNLNDVVGDTTLMFAHNTDFTDIMWNYLLTVEFSGMNPHVGQDVYLAVVDASTGKEVGRTHTVADTAFALMVPGIEYGKSYHVDFWADFNENEMYDDPPTDHAWRLELDDVMGDTTLMFAHNTNFTDIMWKNSLTVEFSGMNPHEGQDIYLAVVDANTGMEIGRAHTVADTAFTMTIPGIESGQSYDVNFWADFNENGMYDTPPDDHAWQLELNSVVGDTTLTFVHNTDFTDIMWTNMLTVEFSGMNPHVGQNIYLAVTDTLSGKEVGRTQAVADTAFSLMVPGIEPGQSYHVDFWVDFNENGVYDTPPDDHAWRLNLNNVTGDTTLMFSHNTDFTDIMWKYQLAVEFTEMTPHLGQMFVLYVVDADEDMVLDTVTIEEIADPGFTVYSSSLTAGSNYHINFWADYNENGTYDAPPADHAWQLVLENVTGDTTLIFVHNTEFTDIFPVTSAVEIGSQPFRMYPNPATNKVWIESDKLNMKDYTLSVFDLSGRMTALEQNIRNDRIELNVQKLTKGIYFVELKTTNDRTIMKLIKK